MLDLLLNAIRPIWSDFFQRKFLSTPGFLFFYKDGFEYTALLVIFLPIKL